MDTQGDYRLAWEKLHQKSLNPFDQETANPWVVELESRGQIRGAVLDAGCGAGHNALYLAEKGYPTTGFDISSHAIDRAKEKALERGSKAQFFQVDLCHLTGHDAEFDTVVDIGCFHSVVDSLTEQAQDDFVASLHRACRSGAGLFLRCLSERNRELHPDWHGPAVSEQQIRRAFLQGWRIDELRCEVISLPELRDANMTVDVWFAHVSRVS